MHGIINTMAMAFTGIKMVNGKILIGFIILFSIQCLTLLPSLLIRVMNQFGQVHLEAACYTSNRTKVLKYSNKIRLFINILSTPEVIALPVYCSTTKTIYGFQTMVQFNHWLYERQMAAGKISPFHLH